MDLHIDLGQVLIVIMTSAVAIIGWLVRREISAFTAKLQLHEARILSITDTLSRVVGEVGVLTRIFTPSAAEVIRQQHQHGGGDR